MIISSEFSSITVPIDLKKCLSLNYCFEKYLNFQSALKISNFPGKVLENDFLKTRSARNLIFLCISHIWFEKNNGI